MLFHPAKVPLKVFSILFKSHSACCDLPQYEIPQLSLQYPSFQIPEVHHLEESEEVIEEQIAVCNLGRVQEIVVKTVEM